MSIPERLEHWERRGLITPQQCALFVGLVRQRPFSLFVELNVLLYAGVLAFVGGLGWTVTTFSRQMGDVLVVTVLTGILCGCLYYCISRVPPWSKERVAPHSFLSDYVLYLCCLVWAVELAYLEQRFNLLAGQWDHYLLMTALFFFFLAYRFDNRLVLSLALSSLAGWFGVTIARLPFAELSTYRVSALSFCAVVMAGGVLLYGLRVKRHFLGTYLNLVANILMLAMLSGVIDSGHRGLWFVALLLAGGASALWGVRRREFAFVAYAAVYTYLGAASLLLRLGMDSAGVLIVLILAATAVLVGLVVVANDFKGRR